MVSLNEKRSKIRYVVQNKTDWVDDGNKFGQRMLEKMGWQTGFGLGKNNDGRIEHIDLKLKDNLKGVGYKHGKYDDTWISHSLSFDSVLQQLQQSHPTSSSPSLQSFGETIRQTNTRFTYKKQSSGKDLSSRTNNELDSIFGWNKANQIEEEQLNNQQNEVNETSSNPLYVTSSKSIDDYFKEKSMKKMQINECHSSEHVDDETSTKRKMINENFIDDELDKKENPYSGSNLCELNGYHGWDIQLSFEQILKKKKKRKRN